MRFLVFQHIAVEHPGIFRDFMAKDGIAWDTVELYDGDPVPSLDGYDALVVMGGPMEVWEEAEQPWLVPEKACIREAVAERRMPFLGICLGHQLLADALGGRVAPMAAPEVGILEVELTAEGRRDPLFKGLANTSKCLQWHGCEVVEPPLGSEILVCSAVCPIQAFRVGDNAYGLQYHIELTMTTVSDWGEIAAYQESLDSAMGPGALGRLDAEAARHMEAFNHDARRLFGNFKHLLTDV
jgi:GMP synthase-like glutamine amidotransferase